MAFYISFGKNNKKYKYILRGAIFAFLTNCIFGYIYNDNLDLFVINFSVNGKELSKHVVYHYIFRFLGILIISAIKFKRDRKSSKEIIKTKHLKSKSSEFSKSLNSSELSELSKASSESSSITLIYRNIKEEIIRNIEIPVFFFLNNCNVGF